MNQKHPKNKTKVHVQLDHLIMVTTQKKQKHSYSTQLHKIPNCHCLQAKTEEEVELSLASPLLLHSFTVRQISANPRKP